MNEETTTKLWRMTFGLLFERRALRSLTTTSEEAVKAMTKAQKERHHRRIRVAVALRELKGKNSFHIPKPIRAWPGDERGPLDLTLESGELLNAAARGDLRSVFRVQQAALRVSIRLGWRPNEIDEGLAMLLSDLEIPYAETKVMRRPERPSTNTTRSALDYWNLVPADVKDRLNATLDAEPRNDPEVDDAQGRLQMLGVEASTGNLRTVDNVRRALLRFATASDKGLAWKQLQDDLNINITIEETTCSDPSED